MTEESSYAMAWQSIKNGILPNMNESYITIGWEYDRYERCTLIALLWLGHPITFYMLDDIS